MLFKLKAHFCAKTMEALKSRFVLLELATPSDYLASEYILLHSSQYSPITQNCNCKNELFVNSGLLCLKAETQMHNLQKITSWFYSDWV